MTEVKQMNRHILPPCNNQMVKKKQTKMMHMITCIHAYVHTFKVDRVQMYIYVNN